MANTLQEDHPPSLNYRPRVNDVLTVKAELFDRFKLPIELVDNIIDLAEYWPHTTTKTTTFASVLSGAHRENKLILRSYPLGFVPSEDDRDPGQMLAHYRDAYAQLESQPWPPTQEIPDSATEEVLKLWQVKSQPRGGKTPCRKIVFTLKSHDQGWGGAIGDHGTYNGSFTWFDVGLERLSAAKETSLESWSLAPFPQFRIIGNTYDFRESTSDVSKAPIVCSLRTIYPPTVVDTDPPEDEIIVQPPGLIAHPIGRHQQPPPLEGEELPQPEMITLPFMRRRPMRQPVVPPPVTRREPDLNVSGEPVTKYKFDHSFMPTDMTLQKNLTATRATKEYVVTWSANNNINAESAEAKELSDIGRGRATASGEVVRSLEIGDVITVWAKARFPGWCNTVEDAQIDVYWAV